MSNKKNIDEIKDYNTSLKDDFITEYLNQFVPIKQNDALNVFLNLQKANRFALKGEFSFMCDIATVVFTYLPLCSFTWPSWFTFGNDTYGNDTITVDFNKLEKSLLKTYNHITYQGLAWIVCTLYAYYVPYKELYSKPRTFEYDQIVNYQIMLPNCVYNAVHFGTYEAYATQLFMMINNMSQNGGNPDGNPNGNPNGNPLDIWSYKPKQKQDFFASLSTELTLESGNAQVKSKVKSKEWLNTKLESTTSLLMKMKMKYQDLETLIMDKVHIQQLQLKQSNIRSKILELQPKISVGGKTKCRDQFKVYLETNTKRKFIRRSRTKWFLDEHRGKYRFIDDTKSHIRLCGQ